MNIEIITGFCNNNIDIVQNKNKSFNQEIIEHLKQDARSLSLTMSKYLKGGNDAGSTYKNLAQSLEKIMYLINEYDEDKSKTIECKDIVVNGGGLKVIDKNGVETLFCDKDGIMTIRGKLLPERTYKFELNTDGYSLANEIINKAWYTNKNIINELQNKVNCLLTDADKNKETIEKLINCKKECNDILNSTTIEIKMCNPKINLKENEDICEKLTKTLESQISKYMK
jgi:hypothetical protein